MSQSNIPNDGDKTIIIPRPGGRDATTASAPAFGAAQQPQARPATAAKHNTPLGHTGCNPLISAASPLLALVSQLRNSLSHNDVSQLRSNVLNELEAFKTHAEQHGLSRDAIFSARYILCAVLDETVLNTVWGSSSIWSQQSLLSTLHNETSGGETFFIALDRLMGDPNADMQLLELMYICLTQGFKGKYQIIERGDEKLAALQQQVYQRIRGGGLVSEELSPQWQTTVSNTTALRRYVPIWVIFSVAGLLLLGVFFGFTMVLEQTSEPVFTRLQELGG